MFARYSYLALIILVTGCRVQITVPPGGSVISESGTYSCQSGQVCTIDVSDEFFSETFVAKPAPGFKFTQWKKRPVGFSFCSKAQGTCTLKTQIFGAFPNLMPFLKQDTIYLLEPDFDRLTSHYWQHEDVKAIDPWGETGDTHSDIIALYEKEEDSHIALRVDYMDLSSPSLSPTFLGLDFKSGGSKEIFEGSTISFDIAWDVLLVAEGSEIKAYDSSYNLLDGVLSDIIIDRHVDYLSVNLDRSALSGRNGSALTLQALTTNDSKSSLVDQSVVASSRDRTGRAKLVMVNNTADLPLAPYDVDDYDGYATRADERPGVIRGYRPVLDAAETYEIPISIADVRLDGLTGWEFYGANDRYRELYDMGLLSLLSNSSYGQMMPWWPNEANAKIIELASEIKTAFDIPESDLYFPYEGLVRVGDLEVIKNAGYGAVYTLIYDWWFCCGVTDYRDREKVKNYVKQGRKIHQVNGVNVIFDPQSFGSGFYGDERWPESESPFGLGYGELSQGTDKGLHSYYRRSLIDLALDQDQQQFMGAGGDDYAFTKWVFDDVVSWNFEWLALHPWIEVTTFNDILSRGWDVINHGTLDLNPDEHLQQVFYQGDGHYNAFFPMHYYGGVSDGENSPLPAGTEVEGIFDYIPYLRDGERIPSGRRFGDYKTVGTIVYETLQNLSSGAENTLLDLAWLMFHSVNGEITFREDGGFGIGLASIGKQRANTLGQVNKIVAAANWAEATSNGEYSSSTVTQIADLDLDGEDEYVIHNNEVFVVFENDGGRVEYAFAWDESKGPIQLIGPSSQIRPLYVEGDDYQVFGEAGSGGWDDAAFVDTPGGQFFQIAEAMSVSVTSKTVTFATADNALNKRFSLSGDTLTADYTFNGDFNVSTSFCFVTNMMGRYRQDWMDDYTEVRGDNYTGWTNSNGGYAVVNQGDMYLKSYSDSPVNTEMRERADASGYPEGHYYQFPRSCTGLSVYEGRNEVSITLRASR